MGCGVKKIVDLRFEASFPATSHDASNDGLSILEYDISRTRPMLRSKGRNGMTPSITYVYKQNVGRACIETSNHMLGHGIKAGITPIRLARTIWAINESNYWRCGGVATSHSKNGSWVFCAT
ncbi:hypothetical protein VE03_09123 [Pseudogymnoascus sp. 23342-1-I1]|nr:hypothetical protein VE03_09123 [Pseudogymnoascus sp. 23342-1-I1]